MCPNCSSDNCSPTGNSKWVDGSFKYEYKCNSCKHKFWS